MVPNLGDREVVSINIRASLKPTMNGAKFQVQKFQGEIASLRTARAGEGVVTKTWDEELRRKLWLFVAGGNPTMGGPGGRREEKKTLQTPSLPFSSLQGQLKMIPGIKEAH